VYDQNALIYGFRELKGHLDSIGKSDMYERLKQLAVLQSGLSGSKISFTSLLPYEDFKELYNQTLSKLEKLSNLDDFHKLNIFERNNWNNDDVVPYTKAQWKFSKKKKKWYYNLDMTTLPSNVKDAVAANEIPQVVTMSKFGRNAGADIIVYTWEEGTKQEKQEKKKIGDYSYIKKGLFKLVRDEDGTPISHGDYEKYVYKMINAWGDSFRANEMYNVATPSKINNGFIPVENEVSDETIRSYFTGNKQATRKESDFMMLTEFSVERRNEILNNYADKHKMTLNEALASIDAALKVDADLTIMKLKECY
jgi:hypothetical protein